jgi:DNA-binding NtrC family response regulator
VRFFLGRAARNLAKPHVVLTPEVEKVLLAHGWPGNVRELENTMEQIAILCDDVIKPDDLPVTSSGPARPVLFRDIECQAIDDALRDNDGNRTKTARQLGISLLTLHTV